IIGGIYGSGIIEEEYRRARDRNLFCLIYFKDEQSRETEPDKAERLAAFKSELSLHHSISTFSSPEELSVQIPSDLLLRHFDDHLTYSCANAAIGSINILVEGKHPYRLEVGSEHGGIVYSRQSTTTNGRPIVSSPARAMPDDLIGRDADISMAKYLLERGTTVVVFGPPGVGKSAFLRSLAHRFEQTQFPDGVIYLARSGRKETSDLLQIIFNILFEHDTPQKYVASESEQSLAGKRALIILDDVAMKDEEIKRLIRSLPGCSFALSSEKERLNGSARYIELKGLSLE